MEYYVYAHIGKKSEKIRYIGKGKDKRYLSNSGRTSLWYKTNKEEGGFISEKLIENLTEEEAFYYEAYYILNNKNLVNIQNPNSNSLVKICSELIEKLKYEQEAKEFYKYKFDELNNKLKTK
jgi:hypothetical protein